jgi:hypothetical protein
LCPRDLQKEHVQTAMREMLEAVHMQLLRSCSPYEKTLLSALLLEARATSRYWFTLWLLACWQLDC